MKKCVILFAVLIVTLIIAMWIEKTQDHLPADEVALQHPAQPVLPAAEALHPD